uniref:Uncharacterized protein n=1 Tax=Avena sativa TaxID=4498 RepID=A0ACD5ZF91_AVESA
MVEAVVGSFQRRGTNSDTTGMHSTREEARMEDSLVFSETIKDLKTLRSQLYSAAEYFELSYIQEDGKETVISNLKEYAVKALVNTVDHLGSISFKLSSLVDQRFDEVTEANLRVCCIQQRTQVSQASMNREGLSQQSLVITAPKYHKRYILPGGESIPNAVPNFSEMNKVKNRTAQMHQAFTAAAAQPKTKDKQPSFRKLRSMARAPSQRAHPSSPAHHPYFGTEGVISSGANADKRSDSPISSTTPLTRSGSLSKKSSLLKTSSVRVQMHAVSDPKRLAPLRSYADRYNDDFKEGEQTPKKSKKFLKSLLSRRKSRKEEPVPCYFEDY